MQSAKTEAITDSVEGECAVTEDDMLLRLVMEILNDMWRNKSNTYWITGDDNSLADDTDDYDI